MLTVEQRRHVRIMWEYGLDDEEIQRILNATISDVHAALGPMLLPWLPLRDAA